MASPLGSGTSSVSTQLANSVSEGGLPPAAEQRKRKRMLSNRESARRSRMRKRKQLGDLAAQALRLGQENLQILANLKAVGRRRVAVQSENAVLRARLVELSRRLQSLEEILQPAVGDGSWFLCEGPAAAVDGVGFMHQFSFSSFGRQPVVAATDVFHY